jgi:hypothetical protein
VAFLAARRQPAEPALGQNGQFAAGQAKDGGHLSQRPLAQMPPVILHIADGLARETGPGRELGAVQVATLALAADDGGQSFIDEGKQVGRQRRMDFCTHTLAGLNRLWHGGGKFQAVAAVP